jgi:hypothetical protein
MTTVGRALPAGFCWRIVTTVAGSAHPTPVGAHPVRELFPSGDKCIAYRVRSNNRGNGHA